MTTLAVGAMQPLTSQHIWRKILRRRKTAIVTALIVFAILAAVILSLTPLYFAQSTVMINDREARVMSFQQVLSAMPVDLEAVQSEVQVLKSRDLAGKVVDQLHLVEHAEFNPELKKPTLAEQIRNWVKDQIASVLYSTAPTPLDKRALAIDLLERKLTVEPIGRSRAIDVSVRTEDATLSAAIVNAIVNTYVKDQIDVKLQATHRANDFLTTQADEMRDDVKKVDLAVASYRARAGLFEGTKGTLLVEQQIAEATTQLANVHLRHAEAAARAQQAAAPSQRQSLPEVMGSQLISRLQEQESDLTAKAIEAETTVGPRGARAVQLWQAAAETGRKIKTEIDKIAASLSTEAVVQRLNEISLTARITQLRQQLGQSYDAQVRMHALEREAEVARTLLGTMLNRQQEVSSVEALQQADATVLSPASVPLHHAYPLTKIFLFVSAIVAAAAGCTLSILLERKSDGLKSMDEVEPALSVRPLGLIPQLPRRTTASKYVIERPQSAFAESLRGILTTVLPSGSGPRSLLVTSALPNEGKSSTAVALARLAANMGIKTLLIDADLRRPTLHKAVGCMKSPGLIDVLENRVTAASVPQSDTGSALHFVSAGEGINVDAIRLLSSTMMQQSMQAWRGAYDFIVVDSAPAAAVADARVVARCCDETIFVVHWNKTHRGLVAAEIKRMRDTGISIAGLVLTQVNVREHAADHYSDSGVFYEHGNYYQS